MTVTPIAAGGRGVTAPARRPAPRRRREATPHATVHFEVVIAPQGGDEALRDVLDGIAEVARRFGAATEVSAVSTRVTTYPAAGPVVAPPELQVVEEPEARVRLFPRARHATVDGRPVTLSYMEFNLLMHLVKHPHRVWRREELLDSVWGGRRSGVRTVDVHVRRLRVKAGPLITTVPGVGYRLADDAGAAIVRQR
jgi:hypothetical protein